MNAEPAKSRPDGELTFQLNQSHGSFELVLSPILLALLGLWADRSWGSGPWLTIAAAVFGLTGAVLKVVYDYRAKMAAHAASAPWHRDADGPRRTPQEAAA